MLALLLPGIKHGIERSLLQLIELETSSALGGGGGGGVIGC